MKDGQYHYSTTYLSKVPVVFCPLTVYHILKDADRRIRRPPVSSKSRVNLAMSWLAPIHFSSAFSELSDAVECIKTWVVIFSRVLRDSSPRFVVECNNIFN